MGKPGTRHGVSLQSERIGLREGTGGIETSQYPEEEKATATPLVAASETGYSPNRTGVKPGGVAGWGLWEPIEGAPDPSRSYKAST
jgi:hypothetical protein